jgi:hypothetical protein
MTKRTRFCVETKGVFDQFPKYNTTILLADIKEKLSRKKLSK